MYNLTITVSILLLLFYQTSSAEDCENSIFSIEYSRTSDGRLILNLMVEDLKECAVLCAQEKLCGAFNYLISAVGEAHCLLLDTSKESKDNERPLDGQVLIAGTKRCLAEPVVCHQRSFHFTRFRSLALRTIGPSNTLHEMVTDNPEPCMQKCLETPDCRSIVFSAVSSLCILSTISPNTVYNTRLVYRYDETSDVYENNCKRISTSTESCSFLRVGSAGLEDQWDSRQKSENVEECERLCVQREHTGDTCRSYTFNKSLKSCLMSIFSSRQISRSPLSNLNKNLSHGDLDDCIDFSLQCNADSFRIIGTAMRQFSGALRTKQQKKVLCENVVQNSFEFSTEFEFEQCGIIENKDSTLPSFHALVHIKEGSTNLVTVRDKLINLECRLHSQVEPMERELSYNMRVDNKNNSQKLSADSVIMMPVSTTEAPRPRFSIAYLDPEGRSVRRTTNKQIGWVSISSKRELFNVRNLFVRETISGSTIPLLDTKGCPSNESLIKEVERPTPNELRFRIDNSHYVNKAELVFEAWVEPCTSQCMPQCLEHLMQQKDSFNENRSLLSNVRLKRSATSHRHVSLANDVYVIHGGRVVMMSQSNIHNQTSIDDVYIEKASSSVGECVSKDPTCLLTFILGAFQLLLLISCVVILYSYIRKWLAWRAGQGTHDHQVIQVRTEDKN